jgi:hypothetical protein
MGEATVYMHRPALPSINAWLVFFLLLGIKHSSLLPSKLNCDTYMSVTPFLSLPFPKSDLLGFHDRLEWQSFETYVLFVQEKRDTMPPNQSTGIS